MARESDRGGGEDGRIVGGAETESLPLFSVENVQLQFAVASDFVAAQVANNVLILALASGRILRIDLDNPADIDDIDLPRRTSEIGVIRRLFLDPSASHLIISTTLGENYYLHTQGRQPRALSKLRGVAIESVAWSPSLPTASTREILLGARDGSVYEVFIEPSTEFYRREERYVRALYRVPDGAVTGLWADTVPGEGTLARRILLATPKSLLHFVGVPDTSGGGGAVYARIFDAQAPAVHEYADNDPAAPSGLSISPDAPGEQMHSEAEVKAFAWLSSRGIFHGRLRAPPAQTPGELGAKVFAASELVVRGSVQSGSAGPKSQIIRSSILTQWHILCLVQGRLTAVNRLNGLVVYDEPVLEPGQTSTALGLAADAKKNTFWLFTTSQILEIVVHDEDRDIWRILLARKQFDAALRYARSPSQRDAVATASGDYLAGRGRYLEAAGVYGKSSKSFEQVALTFIDHDEPDALRTYLLAKLASLKKSAVMQRVMLASWLVEVFMAKLNALDDASQQQSERERRERGDQKADDDRLKTLRADFYSFMKSYQHDLDKKTTYDIISSHGREEELLFFAGLVKDYTYVLAYWVQRERWPDALEVLKKQTDPEVFYKYSSVLMIHVPAELVDILMRQSNLEPRSLIPALLNHGEQEKGREQAVRYLLFAVKQLGCRDAAVHNTLISMYAARPGRDERGLLAYLESQSSQREQDYDADFALRLCIQHERVHSCVHIYSAMGQYASAVDLALRHDQLDLAEIVADRPMENPALRKKLWMSVAKGIIARGDRGESGSGVKSAIQLLKRCELLKLEDLIPFFPDFVVIDDFKDEICSALETYSREIDSLKREMDESGATAAHIQHDIAALQNRHVIVEPGERCSLCDYPLLSRQFFVFPCQHAFHSDCLGKAVMQHHAGLTTAKRIRDLQAEVSRAVSAGARRERAVAELDTLVAASCVLCSDAAIKGIDEPFSAGDANEWAL